MKFTYAMWVALAVISFMTAGFIPAVILTGLAIAGSVSTGLSVQDRLSPGGSYKQLR